MKGKIPVSWTGTDPDGDELLYTVFYSPDGGKTWRSRAFEEQAAKLDVLIDPGGTDHQIRVIASDGTRSGETTVRFSVAGPAAAPRLGILVSMLALLLLAGGGFYYLFYRNAGK
jgi:hypothetical protein